MPIEYTRSGDLALIALTRQDALNAMNRAMYRELNAAVQRFLDDGDAKVAILHSTNDRAFCAGVDVRDIHRAMHEEKQSIEDLKPQFSLFFEEPAVLSKPMIAAIHGHCVGEGLVMSMFCDLRIASADAIFSLPEAKIGVPAINGTARAVQLIGHGAAMELLLTGEARDAAWATSVGLVNEVVARRDLLERARVLGQAIAGMDQTACGIIRQAAENVLEQSFHDAVAAGTASRDGMQTTAMIDRQRRFLEKHKK